MVYDDPVRAGVVGAYPALLDPARDVWDASTAPTRATSLVGTPAASLIPWVKWLPRGGRRLPGMSLAHGTRASRNGWPVAGGALPCLTG